jgi:hypothetical protein
VATETRDAGCCCGETCSFYCDGQEPRPGVLYWLINAPDSGTFASHCTPANGMVVSCAFVEEPPGTGCVWDGLSAFWTSPVSDHRLQAHVLLQSSPEGMHGTITVSEYLSDETTIVDTIGTSDVGAAATTCNPITATFPVQNCFSSRGTDVNCQLGGSIYE